MVDGGFVFESLDDIVSIVCVVIFGDEVKFKIVIWMNKSTTSRSEVMCLL